MARRVIWRRTLNVQRPPSNFEFQNFYASSCRRPLILAQYLARMTEPPYRIVAVASTFSPRFLQVLAEAKRVRERLCRDLQLIYVGKCDDETSRKFSAALLELALPEDSRIHYHEH